MFEGRARFPNICAGPSGTLVALGTVGIKRERRVVARRSTDQGESWQEPVHVADGIKNSKNEQQKQCTTIAKSPITNDQSTIIDKPSEVN